MNRHTFQDTVSGKKKSLVEDLDLGDEEEIVGRLDKEIEGEEEEDYSERFKKDVDEKLEPFNLRKERETGYFDENENYVFVKEKGEVDEWLKSLNEKKGEATSEELLADNNQAENSRKENEKMRMELKERELQFKYPLESPYFLFLILFSFMEPTETITQTMSRLSGKSSTKKESSIPRRRPKETIEKNQEETSSINAKKTQSEFLQIFLELNEILSNNISFKEIDYYTITYETLLGLLFSFQYQGQQDQLMHGPYSFLNFYSWQKQGYFIGNSAVYLTPCGYNYNLMLMGSTPTADDVSSLYTYQITKNLLEKNISKFINNEYIVEPTQDSVEEMARKKAKTSSIYDDSDDEEDDKVKPPPASTISYDEKIIQDFNLTLDTIPLWKKLRIFQNSYIFFNFQSKNYWVLSDQIDFSQVHQLDSEIKLNKSNFLNMFSTSIHNAPSSGLSFLSNTAQPQSSAIFDDDDDDIPQWKKDQLARQQGTKPASSRQAEEDQNEDDDDDNDDPFRSKKNKRALKSMDGGNEDDD